jgi:hypothetical protein
LPSATDHIVPSYQSTRKTLNNTAVVLKRSNSMICPQQHYQTFLNQNNNNTFNHRNSICLELAGCSTDESSTDDYQLIKSSNHYWTKPICSTMTEIDEHENVLSIQPATIIEESNLNHINENEEEEKSKNICLYQLVNNYTICFFAVQYHHHYPIVNRRLSLFHHLNQLWMLF